MEIIMHILKAYVFKTIVALFILVLVSYSLLEPYLLQYKYIDIIEDTIPAHFNKTTIVFVADIHHGRFFNRIRLKKLIDNINSLDPDIVLLGGDYIFGSPDYIEPCFKELSKLKTTLGTYGVLGNHDHQQGAQATKQYMKEAQIILLDNDAVWIEKEDHRIKVGGVGDYYFDRQDIAPTVNDVNDGDFVILLSHNPDFVETIKTDKINLVLSGHNHGGQVTFFGLWAPLMPTENGQKYRSGVIQTNNTKVIVSNGVGNSYLPIRFFARPEVLVLTLLRET